MKTITDFKGQVYALDQVIAVEQGGTPHYDLPLPRNEPTAILVYASGARVQVLAPLSKVLAAWNPPSLADLAAAATAAAKVAADAAAQAADALKAAQAAQAAAAAAPPAPAAPPGLIDAPPGLVDAAGNAK